MRGGRGERVELCSHHPPLISHLYQLPLARGDPGTVADLASQGEALAEQLTSARVVAPTVRDARVHDQRLRYAEPVVDRAPELQALGGECIRPESPTEGEATRATRV